MNWLGSPMKTNPIRESLIFPFLAWEIKFLMGPALPLAAESSMNRILEKNYISN